jgi:hypothetical protein
MPIDLILSPDPRIQHYRKQYTTDELLRLALTMLDEAAKQQRGKRRWLQNNLTLEVIRDRVAHPSKEE